MATETISGAAATPRYSGAYKSTVLGLLVVAYTLNFVDRTIISTIGQAIKDDLKITDTQLGLLGGLYFALLYTLLGIPIARMAERFNRVNIISAAIVIWSGFTALCGTATSFAMLAAYRFGVGFGEAGLSPPAHSLISDYFEPKKRASALSIYAFGIPLGTMIGAVAGGWLAQDLTAKLVPFLAHPDAMRMDGTSGVEVGRNAMLAALPTVLAVMLVGGLSGAAGNLLQTGFMFTPEKLKPDASKLNVLKAFQRLFALDNLVNFLKSAVKIFVTGIGSSTTYPDYKPAPFIVASGKPNRRFADLASVCKSGSWSDPHAWPDTSPGRPGAAPRRPGLHCVAAAS